MSKKRFAKILAMVLATVMLAGLIGCSSPAPSSGGNNPSGNASSGGEKLALIAGHVLDTQHPVHQGFVEMDRLLKEKSGGNISLNIFPNAQLGDEEPSIEALKTGGSIDLTAPSAAPLQAYAKEFMVCDFPFSFANYDEVWKFYDGEMGEYLYKKLEPSGIIGLAWWDNGFRNYTTTSKEIHTPADMKGLKMRTMNAPVHMAGMNAVGASATPIAFSELYSALQQGVVDGEENPVANIYGSKFYEVQKYLIMSRHVHDPSPLLISAVTWNKLSDDQKKMVKDAGIEAGTFMRQASIDQEEGKKEELKQLGMTIIDLTDAEHQQFVDATKDVYKQFISEAGQEAVDMYVKCLAEAKK